MEETERKKRERERERERERLKVGRKLFPCAEGIAKLKAMNTQAQIDSFRLSLHPGFWSQDVLGNGSIFVYRRVLTLRTEKRPSHRAEQHTSQNRQYSRKKCKFTSLFLIGRAQTV